MRGFNPLLDIHVDQLELDLAPGGCLAWAELGDAEHILEIMRKAFAVWDKYQRPAPEPTFFDDPDSEEARAAFAEFEAQQQAWLDAPYLPAASAVAFRLYHGLSTARQHQGRFRSMADAARYFAHGGKIESAACVDDAAIYALLALVDANDAFNALMEVPRRCLQIVNVTYGHGVEISSAVPEPRRVRRGYHMEDVGNAFYALRLLGCAGQYLQLSGQLAALGGGEDAQQSIIDRLQVTIDTQSNDIAALREKAHNIKQIRAMAGAKTAFYSQAEKSKWVALAKKLTAAGECRKRNGALNMSALAARVAQEHDVVAKTVRNYLMKNLPVKPLTDPVKLP